MPSTISLTYGVNCQPDSWNAAVRDLRSSCRETQNSCFALHHLEPGSGMPYFTTDINGLLNQCVAPEAIRTAIEIQFLLETKDDVSTELASQLAQWASAARQAAKSVGIWQPAVNLIWIVQDSARNYEAAQILFGGKPVFDRKFFISTKQSNLAVLRETALCWYGVPALLRVISERPRFSASSMTIGFARLQCSVADMQHYAKDQLAKGLIAGSVKHEDAVKKLQDLHPDWLSVMVEKVMEYAQCVFYYVPKQDVAVAAVLTQEQVEKLLEDQVQQWRAALLAKAEKTPFPEDFLNALNSKHWTNCLENLHRENLANVAAPLKVPIRHRELVEAYNAFQDQYRDRFGQILQRFKDKLFEETERLKQALRELVSRRNAIVEKYFADVQFISWTENAFTGVSRRVTDNVVAREMEASEADYLSAAYDAQAWDRFFEQNVAAMNLQPQELLEELRQRNGNEIANLCDQHLESKAHTVYARMVHTDFESQKFDRYYLLPEQVQEPIYPTSNPNSRHTTIRIDVPGYGNIEKLVFADVPNPLETMTSFQQRPSDVGDALPRSPRSSRYRETPQEQEPVFVPEADASQGGMPFAFYVHENGEVAFAWPDTSENILTLQLIDQQSQKCVATQNISQTDFQINGNRVLFKALDGRNGHFTVALYSGVHELASRELELRRDVYVQDVTKTIEVAGHNFVQHTLQVDHAQLDGDDITSYMELVVGHKHIPIEGKQKRNFTEWTVVTEEGHVPRLTVKDRAGWYYRLIIG